MRQRLRLERHPPAVPPRHNHAGRLQHRVHRARRWLAHSGLATTQRGDQVDPAHTPPAPFLLSGKGLGVRASVVASMPLARYGLSRQAFIRWVYGKNALGR